MARPLTNFTELSDSYKTLPLYRVLLPSVLTGVQSLYLFMASRIGNWSAAATS